MTRLRSYQAELVAGIESAWAGGAVNVMAVSPARSGKCLGKDTPVLMFDGSIKAVQDVMSGDLLMGPDSRPRAVLSTCSGVDEMYRVTPCKGDTYVVNSAHILSLKLSRLRKVARTPNEQMGGGIHNINVVDFLNLPSSRRQNLKGWRTGVEFGQADLPLTLPPYFLGLWLGDGHSRTTAITTMDDEIIHYLWRFAASLDLSVRNERAGGQSNTHHITSHKKSGRGVSMNVVKTTMREFNLLNNKHIPFQYKTASRAQRLELLAGLMDSDGHWTGFGYETSTKLETLANDIAYLARSLGFASYVKVTMKSCNGGPKAKYYRIAVSGNLGDVPCIIARKKAKLGVNRTSSLVSGITVEPIGTGEYFGFEIDGDHLFMLGDFTVTHNTVIFSDIIGRNQGGAVAIAHRARLVEQMSFALAKAGVRHRVIGPASLQRACSARHMAKLKRDFVNPTALVAVASVNTLCKKKHEPWFDHVTLWVTDEGHHLLRETMWGVATSLFPRARGLSVTATPCRADGKGLGRSSDGVIDAIVIGRSPRELINMGYIVDYRLALAESDINIAAVPVGASGEFVPAALSAAVHASKRFVGDVVAQYQLHGRGESGICFAVDVASAIEIAAGFNAAGVRAEVVTAETADTVRLAIMAEYEAGRIRMLVNVDLFGEGVDLPDVRVVIMARHTNSYGLFIQQFWRGGTLLISDELQARWSDFTDAERRAHIAASAKPKFVVIDHVGNVMRHARTRRLPCVGQNWSLDRREASARGASVADDVIPLRTCLNPDANDTGIPCAQPYERVLDACPHCGFVAVPASRAGPEHVDGDLLELDAATLAALRGEVARAETPPEFNRFLGQIVNMANNKRHADKMDSQGTLRTAMQMFCAYQIDHMGRSQSEMYKRFYFAFGVASLSALALGAREAEALRARIAAWLEKQGVVHG